MVGVNSRQMDFIEIQSLQRAGIGYSLRCGHVGIVVLLVCGGLSRPSKELVVSNHDGFMSNG